MSERITYRCRACPGDDGWTLSAPQVPNVFSQAFTEDEIEPMIRDAIALMLEIPEDSFDVVIEEGPRVVISDEDRAAFLRVESDAA